MARRWLGPVLAGLLLAAPAAGQQKTALDEMSLEQLLSVTVVSASNAKEKLAEAPATVVVITRDDVTQRGYTDLSQLLDDLPGMQPVRPYGATYTKNYWRGYRNTIGDPYLLLLDGIVLNHLYFDTADVLTTLPLSNVERVEVVYGPASSIYGPNAFMGVINVITHGGETRAGTSFRGTLSIGSSAARIADVTAEYRRDDWWVRATARFDDGELDGSHADLYEYTRERYYADRRLWGGFLDSANLGGSFLSAHRNRAADLRVGLGGLEGGVTYQLLRSGYGTEYAGDEAQTNGVWSRPDLSAFLRFQKKLSPAVSSSTLLRYRSSGVSNDSYFVESFAGADAAGRPVQLARLTYWQALNSSWSLIQDFEGRLSPTLGLNAGFKYEQKDLQKAYDIAAGPAVPVTELDASRYPYPTPPVDSTVNQNRTITADVGGYVQGKWRPRGPHQLNLGVRLDRNSKYGAATTVRAGYVGDFGAWGAKALYGEAFQEPNPRLLYGGWTGSGSDPNLDPERSRTVEVSGTYKSKALSGLVSAYLVRNRDTIVNTASGARNLGDREVIGADVHLQALLRAPVPLRLWGYYSHLFRAREESAGGMGEIGDLAEDRLLLGVTATPLPSLNATLRGRAVSRQTTVATNPVGEVPGYVTLDLTVVGSDLLVPGLGLTLAVTNLLDRRYAQPGVRDANAGTEPGSFDASGAWHGSAGFYSSLLPQPGRNVTLSMRLEF